MPDRSRSVLRVIIDAPDAQGRWGPDALVTAGHAEELAEWLERRLAEEGWMLVQACPLRGRPDDPPHEHHGRRPVTTGKLFGSPGADEPSGEEWCDGERIGQRAIGEGAPPVDARGRFVYAVTERDFQTARARRVVVIDTDKADGHQGYEAEFVASCDDEAKARTIVDTMNAHPLAAPLAYDEEPF